MDGTPVDDALAAAVTAFERPPESVETGLRGIEEPGRLQHRKACRLLAAGDRLLADGYYTVVVEVGFGAVERSIQHYLYRVDATTRDDYLSHERVYERGREAGLYDREFEETLTYLWPTNRSRTYYREGVGTETRARRMLALAAGVHEHVVGLAGREHDCVCGDRVSERSPL